MEYVRAFVLALWSVLITVLIGLLLFLFVQDVHASTWNERTCGYVARDAAVLHGIKSGGMTWMEAEPQVRQALEAALREPDSYVKDARDAQRSYEVAQFVWAHDMPVEPTVQIVMARCLKEWAGPEI